ncbi:N-acetylmuramoyl-L-alanine amidase family protein [Evansella sp. AB-rgal1]|uniref:peptidoglycan recognition protein family protein n=1 Tax=Evansella sp. AB-rgal1 TaxID=3242696 RepID=UPI00359EF35D
MRHQTKFMTKNDCFQAGRKIRVKGIMLHSTAVPGVMAGAWFERWNRSFRAGEMGRQVCVHGFVDDREVWQYLPWDHRGWHAGGAANDSHVGLEMCEPSGFSYGAGARMVGYDVGKNEGYFRKTWENAVALCVLLCERFGLSERDVICHAEGHRLGIASNHGDVMHWFPKHGESMESFRTAVGRELRRGSGIGVAREGVVGNLSMGGGKVGLTGGVKVGGVVEFVASAGAYYPGGPGIPSWVKGSYHKVTQVVSQGRPVVKGGKECVLLGVKVDKGSGKESAGIMTWVDRGLVREVVIAGARK